MSLRTTLKHTALGLVIAAANAVGARANECPTRCGHYETIVVCKAVEVPCIKVVTLYDHCGRPYQATRRTTKVVEVSVRKTVFVAD